MLAMSKLKDIRVIFKQIHIINMKAKNSIFPELYLTNILINLKENHQTFYKINV